MGYTFIYLSQYMHIIAAVRLVESVMSILNLSSEPKYLSEGKGTWTSPKVMATM